MHPLQLSCLLIEVENLLGEGVHSYCSNGDKTAQINGKVRSPGKPEEL